MNAKQTEIAIIGGGIAGLTFASLLGGAGLNIALIEPRPPEPFKDTKPSGRTVALMENSINIIKAASVWEKISGYAQPIEMMKIIDDSMPAREPQTSEFPASEIGQDQFGFNIPNVPLRAALYEHVQNIENITIYNSALQSLSAEDSAFITLEDDTTIQASLIVGADGRSSKTRELCGIDAKTHPYGQNAITCVINHSKAHQNISTEFHYPSGPLALVPLQGNQSSVVWVEKETRAEELLKLKKGEFETALQTATNDLLGGIMLETGPESWPLISIKADKITAPRTALIAEAAHVMSPITAQGLNLSLRDVATLAEEIVDAARLGLDIGSNAVLSKYEKRRRLDIGTRIFGVDNMNKIVSNDIPAIKGLRRAGFKTMDALPPLKKFATAHALAPPIDKSRLAKGESL